jgi:hypothetical protein
LFTFWVGTLRFAPTRLALVGEQPRVARMRVT